MEKNKKWANSLLIILVITGGFLSFYLAIYISDNPDSIIGRISFATADFLGGYSGNDDFAALAFGSL